MVSGEVVDCVVVLVVVVVVVLLGDLGFGYAHDVRLLLGKIVDNGLGFH